MTQDEIAQQIPIMMNKILIMYPHVVYFIMLALCFMLMIYLIASEIIDRFWQWRKKRRHD